MSKYKRKPIIVEAEQYTDPASVGRIMDMIGTSGVNNSTCGLWIYRDNLAIRANKTDFIVKHNNGKIEKFDKDYFYRLFERIKE